MAERRMFAKTIIDSDAFLDMPVTSQLLYFHLAMRADDDGFINNPKKIMRMVGCNDDDMRILVAKQFIIPFESGIIVIRHWKIHNYIRSDRYKPTTQPEKELVELDGSMVYQPATTCLPDGIPMVARMDTQDRLGKDRIGKVRYIGADEPPQPSKKANVFHKPTMEEVAAYCQERGNNIDPQRFIDHYESNGWMVGRTKMKDWKATVRTWEKNQFRKLDPMPEPDMPPDGLNDYLSTVNRFRKE